MSPKPKSKPSVYYWENGHRADAAIHEPILAGDHPVADKVGREVAKQLGLTDKEIEALFSHGEVKTEKDMAISVKEKLRINLRAKRALGQKKDASDKRIFMSQCVDQLTESGEADSEDDARDICEMLYEEGEIDLED